jgi:hypothetical protein
MNYSFSDFFFLVTFCCFDSSYFETDLGIEKYTLAGSCGVLPMPTMIFDLQQIIKQQIKVRQAEANLQTQPYQYLKRLTYRS